MYRLLIIFMCCTCSVPLFSQFEVEDISKKIEKIAPYDSSYFVPDYNFINPQVINGLKNYNLVFLDFPSDFKALVNGKLISSYNLNKEEYLFKPFTIREFKKIEFSDLLMCTKGEDTICFKPSSSDKVIILEGYEKFRNSLLGKYFSTQNQSVTDFTDTKIQIKQNSEMVLYDVKLAKVSSFDFGLKFSFKIQDDTAVFVQNLFNYEEFGTDFLGNLNFQYDLIYNFNLKNEGNYNLIKNSKFRSYITKSQVIVGMSEKEILLSWGAPNRFISKQGYDKVAVYETNNAMVYYKNKKAIKIL